MIIHFPDMNVPLFFFYLYSLSSILHGAWVPPSLSVSKTLAQEVLVFYAGVISSFLAGPLFLLPIFFLIDLIVYVLCVELWQRHVEVWGMMGLQSDEWSICLWAQEGHHVRVHGSMDSAKFIIILSVSTTPLYLSISYWGGLRGKIIVQVN